MRRSRMLSGPLALSIVLLLLAVRPLPAQQTPAPGAPGQVSPGSEPLPAAVPEVTPDGVLQRPADEPGQADPPRPETARSEGVRSLNERFQERHSALNEEFGKQVQDLQKQYLTELAELASQSQGAEATEAYRHLLAYAIATEQYDHAEPAARQFLQADGAGASGLRDLAQYITIVALAERGEHPQAIQELRAYIDQGRQRDAQDRPEPRRLVALGEDLIQRLIRAGKYDLAQDIPALFLEQGYDPEIEAHFRSRQQQLGLIGGPAPAISTVDLDGRDLRLADLLGQVVLLDFWATWCQPCIAEMSQLAQLDSQYRDQGLRIVGVNLDTAREGGDRDEVARMVRGFLIDHGITWPNALDAPGQDSLVRTFGVSSIPSRVLIGRDGNVLAIDLRGGQLDEAIRAALGSSAPPAGSDGS